MPLFRLVCDQFKKPRAAGLLHQLDLPRLPGFVEPRLERAVEAQHGVPAFAGNGLDPVRFMACRSGRAEVDRIGLSPYFAGLNQMGEV